MSQIIFYKKWFWVALLSIILAGGIVWATAELSGQANALAQDSGKNSAEMEELSLAILKKPSGAKAPPCDWKKEKSLREKIENKDLEYKNIIKNVNVSNTEVEANKSKVLEIAQQYHDLQLEYAEMWQNCNCKTRSLLAYKLASSRLKSAQVVVSEADSNKLSEMQTAQEELSEARHAYAKEASQSNVLSSGDKESIKSKIIPRISDVVSQFVSFSANVATFFKEVQNTTQKASSGFGGLLSAGKDLATGGGSNLLNNAKTLFSVSQSMVNNAKGLMSDAQLMTGAK